MITTSNVNKLIKELEKERDNCKNDNGYVEVVKHPSATGTGIKAVSYNIYKNIIQKLKEINN